MKVPHPPGSGKDGEKRGFTAAEFKAVQVDGWEKQYQYKVGKKKVYMTPSAAEPQNLVRLSKYPQSTKYGRQNPIAEKWNSDEQIDVWRKAWADTANAHLEQAGADIRIDRDHQQSKLYSARKKRTGIGNIYGQHSNKGCCPVFLI